MADRTLAPTDPELRAGIDALALLRDVGTEDQARSASPTPGEAFWFDLPAGPMGAKMVAAAGLAACAGLAGIGGWTRPPAFWSGVRALA